MQFQLTRYEYVKYIEFINENPLQNVERIRYFKEFELTGDIERKEFQYSWDNATWTNWNTLTQNNLASIQFRDKPNFWLRIRYHRKGIGSGNIQRWYLFYDSAIAPGPTPPPDASIDADTLQGEGAAYYLDRTNHFGPYTSLTVNNVLDGSTVGVYYGRIDTSLGTELLFKRIGAVNGLSVTEEPGGKIIIDAPAIDASIIGLDASLAELFSRGVINVGDGSVGSFAGYDSSGNIRLRTFIASGATTISEIGDNIIIGIDASFAGEVNYGVNIGDGDASIYFQKLGDALRFRELKSASSELIIDTSGNLVIFDTDSPESLDGGVWITDITPTSGGNVGDKTTSSDGNVLDYCLTDTSSLTVHVLALPGHTNYKPIVTINDVSVSLSASADKPLWTGTYDIDYNFADANITVVHEDGAYWSTIVDADTPAEILSADFINGYPGSQTELKAGDTFDVSIMTDVSIVSVEVDNFGAATGGTYTVSGNNIGFTITIADRGTSTQALGLRLRVVKPTGSTSANYLTSSQGSVDGKDLVNLNNTYPGISITSIDYPTGQQAIKSGEDASVNHTVTNYDTINYTSPGGELTINNPIGYETQKYVSYLSGGYNINSNNFSISANRTANNATSSDSTVVWIANTPATLSVSHASKFQSGGNDGTIAQNHQIAINSSQRLLSAPSLVKGSGGTWQGTGFSWSSTATTFTRNLEVHDDMTKGTFNWGDISGTNLAGIVTSSNSGTTQYIFSGFVVRTITVPAFGWETSIGVQVTDYTKLSSTGSGQTLAWSVKDLTVRSSLGDITRPQPDTWSASATGTNPTTIRILDESATGSSSQATTFTIQEGI